VRTTVRAEWTKAVTVRGTVALLLLLLAGTAGASIASVSAARCGFAGCGQDPGKISLLGVQVGQAVAAVAGVLAIGSEYGTGMIQVTLAATPRRGRVLAAKAIVLSGLVLAASTVAVISAALAGQFILPGHGFTPAHGYLVLTLINGSMLRAVLGSALYLTLVSLLGLGIACVVRDTAAATGVVLGLLYLLPLLGPAFGPDWGRHMEQIAPMMAGLDIQATRGLHSMFLTPWQGLGVVALWAAGALFSGTVAVKVRDA
jgi:ABC-2 type transport system permease protein